MDATVQRPFHQDLAVVVGPLVAAVTAWLLAVAGSRPSDPLSLANTTLLMAAITLVAAVIDWRAGMATSIVAAIALNYFHTAPYRTLRVTDRQDLLTVALLAALGLLTSAAAAGRARKAIRQATVHRRELAGDTVREQVVAGAASTEIWNSVANAISGELSTTTTRVTTTKPYDMPKISRNVDVTRHNDVVTLPRSGAFIELNVPSGPRFWLVMRPTNPDIVSDVDRQALVMLAQAIEFCIDNEQHN